MITRASQKCGHFAGKCTGIDGLADISVATRIERLLLVAFHGEGRQRDNMNVARACVRLELARERESVHAGQRDIHEYQVRQSLHEDDLRLFDAAPVYFRCRCSRERVAGMLQGLGETETRSVLAERGEVEVRCDFCNRAYVFDAIDVAQLFNAHVAGHAGRSTH